MAFNPGRNAGRVSIRVMPDTTRFRPDLKRKLDQIEKSTSMTIRVDKARLDNAKIRESIRRQMDGIDIGTLGKKMRVNVDQAAVDNKKLRQSMQQQMAKFGNLKLNYSAQVKDVQQFERQVRQMVDRAERNNIDIPVGVTTAIANARLAFAARTRVVTFVVNVSKASISSAMTTLAALSGARLAWTWLDDLGTKLKDLDKSLPAILGMTTGLTSLFASLFAATSGLVGIGQGLFSILPAFLVLPGLLLNSAASLTVLIVALRNAGTELAVLKSDMTELGDIINTTFWTRARQPIIDLVQGLMPQLRNAFRDVSEGVGDFTAAMAKAFGEELANGRLESIFKGIADGWRILGSGASGFAGALVNLSNIAATYTPRLAGWFVRQANTFDAWLSAISTDGRLGAWMETAIDSMYDLWSATTGVAGVFAGLWKAAEAGGSTGLAGFADMMQEWKNTVNGADFQRGLSAVFRGSAAAMDAFGSAIGAVGQLFVDMDKTFERFIGTAGKFFGGLIEGSANALNTPTVERGLNDFSQGLIDALNGIIPELGPIADTFGRFLSLLGELAGTLLPAAAGAFADLMPAVQALMDAIEPVLKPLADALIGISSTLGPAIEGFIQAVGPSFQNAVTSLSDALVDLAPSLASFTESAAPALAAALDGFSAIIGPALKPLNDFMNFASFGLDGLFGGGLFDDKALDKASDKAIKGGGFFGDIAQWARDFDKGFDEIFNGKEAELSERGRSSGGKFSRGLTMGIGEYLPEVGSTLNTAGMNAVTQFGSGFDAGRPRALSGVSSVGSDVTAALGSISLFLEGLTMATTIATGFNVGKLAIADAAASIPSTIAEVMVPGPLINAGLGMMNGLAAGVAIGRLLVMVQAAVLPRMLVAAFPGTMLLAAGLGIMSGLASGVATGRLFPYLQILAVAPMLRGAIPGSLLYGSGVQVAQGLASGINAGSGAAVGAARAMAANVLSATRAELQIASPSKRMANEVGRHIPAGVAKGMDDNRQAITDAARRMSDFDVFGTSDGGAGRGGNTIQITQPLLPGETPAEQRDNIIRELRWAV